MIEKRFTLTNPKNPFQEMKCGINDGYKTLTFNEVIDLLNELHEETEVLEQRLKIYKNDGLETLNDLERAYENNKKALNNIEQLEKRE